MYEFLGWLTVYAVFRLRNDSTPEQAAERAERIKSATMSNGAYLVFSVLCNAVGWCVFGWLVWLIFW